MKKMKYNSIWSAGIATLVLGMVAVGNASAETISFWRGATNAYVTNYTGVADTWLNGADAPDNNFGQNGIMLGTQRGILRFDLAGFTFGGNPVTNAVLSLFVHSASAFGIGDGLNFYLVDSANAAWIEGSQANGPALAGEPTWNNRQAPSTAWTGGAGLGTPGGGGYGALPIATFLSPIAGTNMMQIDVAIPVSVITNWMAGNNAGLLISRSGGGEFDLRTSEDSVASLRPLLTLNTDIPEPSAAMLLGLGGLMVWRAWRK